MREAAAPWSWSGLGLCAGQRPVSVLRRVTLRLVPRARESRLRPDEDILELGVAVDGGQPELSAEPGLLEAAEGRLDAHRGVRVDGHSAALHRPGNPESTAHV